MIRPLLESALQFVRQLLNGDYYETIFSLLPLRAGDRVLEVGCGIGDACRSLPAGVEYLGLDVSEMSLDIARERHQRPGVRFSSVRLQELEGEFTHALVICTLHHLSMDEGREISRELRRLVSGPVLVADPDAEASNWLQRVLLWLDRGDFALRPINGHLDLLREQYDCRQVLTKDLRARLGRLTYSLCRPRNAAAFGDQDRPRS